MTKQERIERLKNQLIGYTSATDNILGILDIPWEQFEQIAVAVINLGYEECPECPLRRIWDKGIDVQERIKLIATVEPLDGVE